MIIIIISLCVDSLIITHAPAKSAPSFMQKVLCKCQVEFRSAFIHSSPSMLADAGGLLALEGLEDSKLMMC